MPLVFLIALFVAILGRGVKSERGILGRDDDRGDQGKHTGQQQGEATPTPTPTPTPTYFLQLAAPTSPTLTPTETLSPSPTLAPTLVTATPSLPPPSQGGGIELSPAISTTSTTTSIISSGFTEEGKQQGTIQTVSNIIRKVVQPSPKVIEKVVEENVTEKVVEVAPMKTTAEILAILDSISAQRPEAGKMARLRYIELGDQIAVVAETSEGKQLALSTEEALTLQRKLLSEAGFRIARGTAGGYVFSTVAVKAKTNLPVLVDLSNSLLAVETSIGIKPVPVSADSAVSVAQGIKMIRGINEKFGEGAVRLKERADLRLVYEVNGISNWKLFGLFPFVRQQTVEVSALSGKIIPIERELNQLLVDLVSRRVD